FRRHVRRERAQQTQINVTLFFLWTYLSISSWPPFCADLPQWSHQCSPPPSLPGHYLTIPPLVSPFMSLSASATSTTRWTSKIQQKRSTATACNTSPT